MAEVEPEYSPSAGWYELPEDTREEILALLPLECLCRSRSVCKDWNALFSSTKFITSRWAEAPPNKKPWLFLCKVNSQMGDCSMVSSAYCFFTRTWKTGISLSFISEGDEKVKYRAYYSGSSQGLFLVDIPDGRYTVCNPLTQTFLKLPPMSSIKLLLTKGIVAWKVGNQETYKVVAVGLSRRSDAMIVEIYDSSEKSWAIAGHLPENLEKFGLSRGIVFCDGFFYCITLNRAAGMGVLGFSIREEGTSIFTPLPELANGYTMWAKLLTCESRILLAGGVGQKRGSSLYTLKKIIELILWEFQKDSNSSCWKEIARMPPSLREVFQRNSYFDSFECVGVGDCMCFTSGRCMDVAVYNLSEETWSWLPTPTSIDRGYGHPLVMVFKPRPDMKVG